MPFHVIHRVPSTLLHQNLAYLLCVSSENLKKPLLRILKNLIKNSACGDSTVVADMAMVSSMANRRRICWRHYTHIIRSKRSCTTNFLFHLSHSILLMTRRRFQIILSSPFLFVLVWFMLFCCACLHA